ncbi:RagB/SusD family nutrient uptake outer membrane protein [Flavihumibacter sp. UBA7668]|uniref:RagB/SusD family nutrient uptake outer membrane protein n=1 Tax=Flavihumibacter sp. UBA7668 TaxID=1946542 RepID=UPI0025B876E0|nr:RagB/SusD family nutrient uptake outer membrane protein [Flavihumibacter sp. UBA7668]
MRTKIIRYSFIIGLLSVMVAGCSKILEEQPRAGIDPSYFRTPEGIQGGIAGIYSSFRGHWGTQIFTQLFNAGNDEFKRGAAADVQHWYNFNNAQIRTEANNYAGFWNAMYININTANGVLEYGAAANMPEATKIQVLAQAKFLRAFCYFYLVTTFGDVPLHTEFNTDESTADSRNPQGEVYAQIIQDLTEAAADLPNIPASGTGKPASKATALYLLAKTHLWRGWSDAAESGDFTAAYTISKDLIDNKAQYGLDLLPYYPAVFKEGNEYSSEILMVIDHTKDLKYGQNSNPGTGATNFQENKSNFFFRPNYPAINANYPSGGGANLTVRDVNNGRPFQRIRPNTRYVIDVAFANRETDSRYEGTFQTVWKSASTPMAAAGSLGAVTPRGQLINGVDTSIWMADRVVTAQERANFKGVIFEPEHLPGATVPYTASYYPNLRKWDDSTRADMNDYSDRPYILFRFAEVYLIAAEAAIQGGASAQQAADMINVLRTRAALKPNQTPTQYADAVAAQQVTAAQMNIDFLLDERSRELFGEATRWWDLARTKKLVQRVQAYNSEGADGVQDHHRLRPIPQEQIDLVTEGPAFPQNPGYQ